MPSNPDAPEWVIKPAPPPPPPPRHHHHRYFAGYHYLRAGIGSLLAKRELGCKINWEAELTRLLEESEG